MDEWAHMPAPMMRPPRLAAKANHPPQSKSFCTAALPGAPPVGVKVGVFAAQVATRWIADRTCVHRRAFNQEDASRPAVQRSGASR